MLKKLYDWTLSLAASRYASSALAGVSFAESSFFPIPPDALLVPMCLANREKCWLFALICMISSVLGGVAGYAIGHFLMQTVGAWIVSIYGYSNAIDEFQAQFRQWGLWIILIKGLTPIPYKLVTIASGAADFNILIFVAASVLTRGIRFFLVAGLLWRYGPPIREFVERRLHFVTWAFLGALIGGFVVVTYVF